ncbi:MAG TPA: hypothetical protein VJM15_02105 [Sphingomicrobium sp.]|nr:hypothetical protein [Sphingomicrobium sp.]
MLIARTIPLSILGALAAGAGAQNPPAAPPPPACTAAEHRQFDFWVGYWDVYPTGTDRLVAHSLIEKLYGGCAIRENWMPLKRSGGGSLSAYRPEQQLWRQTWTDSANGWAVLEGKFDGAAMVLSGPWENVNGPGTKAFARTTWTRNADGSVRQHGETRGDDGRTWTTSFDFTYKPSRSSPPK